MTYAGITDCFDDSSPGWPKDTDDKIYFPFTLTLGEIVQRIKDTWGLDVDDVNISAEYIHVRCLTYDLYDPMDYETFIVVEKL